MVGAARQLVKALALLAVVAAAPGCDWMRKKDPPHVKGENEQRREREAQLRRACASDLTYDRLKEYAFDEAQRIRGQEERLLDEIATYSVVRMEDPVVKSRNEELNVTVCTGRFVLELPPGAVNAFDGERRLSAQVEYAAQAAVDGSGLVYHMTGAEPIIYRLATVGVDQAYGAVKQSCGCHGGGAGGLTFTSASDFRNNMVGVNSQTAAMKIVTAGDIHQSYLIYKILNQHSKVVGGRGNPMPLGKSLSDSQKCLLINWIESGAK